MGYPAASPCCQRARPDDPRYDIAVSASGKRPRRRVVATGVDSFFGMAGYLFRGVAQSGSCNGQFVRRVCDVGNPGLARRPQATFVAGSKIATAFRNNCCTHFSWRTDIHWWSDQCEFCSIGLSDAAGLPWQLASWSGCVYRLRLVTRSRDWIEWHGPGRSGTRRLFTNCTGLRLWYRLR